MTDGYFVRDGVKYEIFDGKAREGDLVLFVKDSYDVHFGGIYEIALAGVKEIIFIDDAGDEHGWDYDGSFLVLRKAEDSSAEPPLDILDMLTNLSRRYNELDERLDSVEKDVRTISIDGEEVAHKIVRIGEVLSE